jgi:hypothetical protein
MKRRHSIALAVALVAAAWFQAQAVVTDVEVNVEPKISSAFVWRGQVLNDEWCFQPTIALQGSNFSLTAFGNWDLTSVTNSTRNTRVDTTLDYSMPSESQILSVGLVAYIYRDSPSVGPDDTFEIFARDTVKVLLLPTATLYYDFSDIKGFYGTFSLAHSFKLIEDTLSLDFKVTLGAGDSKYNEAVFGYLEDPNGGPGTFRADRAALADLTASVSLPFLRTDSLAFTPSIKYTSLLDSNIRDAVDRSGQKTGLFCYSLAVSYIF